MSILTNSYPWICHIYKRVSKQFSDSGTKSERRQVIFNLMKTLYGVCTVPTLRIRCRCCHLIYILVTTVLICHLYSMQCCQLYSIQKLNKELSNNHESTYYQHFHLAIKLLHKVKFKICYDIHQQPLICQYCPWHSWILPYSSWRICVHMSVSNICWKHLQSIISNFHQMARCGQILNLAQCTSTATSVLVLSKT